MGRMNDWQRDVDEGLRHENWSLTGPTRIVKVIAAGTGIGINPKDRQLGGPRLYYGGQKPVGKNAEGH